jgi:SAM-dependent methyltransferase
LEVLVLLDGESMKRRVLGTSASDAISAGPVRLAFGVDAKRPERYSLRQARYDALALDIDLLAGNADRQGRSLSVLDIGAGAGFTAIHLRTRPHFDNIAIDATDIDRQYNVDTALYRRLFLGDLTRGYPELASNSYDVVVCEQVLEHIHELDVAIASIGRLLKPGGRAFVGAPIFPPPLHLARRHLVPIVDRLVGSTRRRGHVQAFSLTNFKKALLADSRMRIVETRGFRIVSGGVLRPLENLRWWWAFNRWLGAKIPAVCIEVQVVLEKAVD